MSAISDRGTGNKWVKFANVGDNVVGTIVTFEDLQDTEFEDLPARGVKKGDLKFYPSGDPVMFTRITLETIPGDESSQVTLDAKGKLMMQAIGKAIRAAGGKDLEIGGDLAVVFTGYQGRAKSYSSNYSVPSAETETPAEPVDDEPPF